jgi:restriction system protein
MEENFPTHVDLMWPTIEAVKLLGGSGRNEEIFDELVKIQKYSEETQSVPFKDGKKSKLEYRAAWARSYLRLIGALENPSRGVWALTDYGEKLLSSDIPNLVSKMIAERGYNKKNIDKIDLKSNDNGETTEDLNEEDWQSHVLEIIKNIKPDAFERLAQRLLREAGFVKVEVTGKSGDGGIDGVGVLKMNLLSFHVYFQCKRYQGSVGAGAVRDFRGAMTGRGDKGIIITSGYFTPDARKEASRDGAPPIDLIDGEELCDLLKRYNLGTHTKMVEQVVIDKNWFNQI